MMHKDDIFLPPLTRHYTARILPRKENIMSAKQSAETKHAIYLHRVEGKSRYEAARLAGIWPSTLYKALKAKPKNKSK
jgi:hypothetical protein